MTAASAAPVAGPPAQRYVLGADGWLQGARHVASPNFDARPATTDVSPAIELLVIHNISLPPGDFGGDSIERLFTNRLNDALHPFLATLAGVRVSSHFLIRRDGELIQFVSCNDRAWHAGASSFRGRPRCNDFSIGVELEGSDFVAFEDAQYDTLAALTTALRTCLPLAAVRGHSEIACARKTDPGPLFAWARYLAKAQLPPTWR